MKKMKALLIENVNLDIKAALASMKTVQIPVPVPGPNEVLIKVAAAPCNPSDLLALQGLYGVQKKLPAVPGWEGSGTVVKTGRGFLAKRLLGKRVACGLQSTGNGTWAEYCVVSALACIPLKDPISFEQGACLLVNPFSAWALFETVKKAGHRGFVHSAGLSQVGKMLLNLELKSDLLGIHLVRRSAQVSELLSLGARHVVSLEDPEWDFKLSRLCQKHCITAGIDAIGGAWTGKILGALPANSTVWLYGALSLKPCAEIAPLDVVFRNKSLRGFYLGNWLASKNIFQILSVSRSVQSLIGSGAFQSRIRTKVSLDEASQELSGYVDRMSDGKVLICP